MIIVRGAQVQVHLWPVGLLLYPSMVAGEQYAVRVRKTAYSRYFDCGWSVKRIREEVMPLASLRTVQRMVKEFRETFSWQEVSSFKARGKVRKKLCIKALNAISEMLTEDPTLYLAQIRSALIDDHGVKVSRSTICRAIHLSEQDGGLGLSLQVLEKRALQRSARDRANWHDRINAGDFDHKNVIVIDESNVGKNMSRRRRGYGKVGQRVRWPEYFGKDRNGTLMAACDTNGFVLSACEYITEGMDSDRCIQYVEHTLAPQLGNYILAERRSVVAMDNVKQHHHPRIREIIEGAGAILIFLPKYRCARF